VSGEDGRFTFAVPTSAQRVAALFSASTSYSLTYGVGGFFYIGIQDGAPDDGSCRVPLSPLSNNRRLNLGNISLFSIAGVPPPPPDGCLLTP
jgi:hypothetical protein